MEVEIKWVDNTVSLRDIKVGECFMFNGKLYMKTDMDSDTSSETRRVCVKMVDGSCELFIPIINVQRVKMSKVIAEIYIK